MEFAIAVPKPMVGQDIPTMSWTNPKAVNCVRIDDRESPQDKEGIIKKIN